MPKAIVYIGLVLVILAMIPPAIIARTRAVPNDKRRIHLIQDMDNQGKFRAQAAAPTLFADGRAMRRPVDGTIARGHLNDDDHFNRGVVQAASGGSSGSGMSVEWATTYPKQLTVDMDFLRRGQDRFNIYCQPCHGISGFGDGIVNNRAKALVVGPPELSQGTVWVEAKSLHEELIRVQPPGQIFNTITHGIRTMGPYESIIPVADRWAIVAYVKALQRSQHAGEKDVRPDQLPIHEEAPTP